MGENSISVSVDRDLEDLVPGFLENRRKDIREVRASIESEDFDIMRVIGHRMKGSGGGYGFAEISEIGAEIENAANARDAATVARNIDRLSDYLERVTIVYE